MTNDLSEEAFSMSAYSNKLFASDPIADASELPDNRSGHLSSASIRDGMPKAIEAARADVA
jgi:hypothetical protein